MCEINASLFLLNAFSCGCTLKILLDCYNKEILASKENLICISTYSSYSTNAICGLIVIAPANILHSHPIDCLPYNNKSATLGKPFGIFCELHQLEGYQDFSCSTAWNDRAEKYDHYTKQVSMCNVVSMVYYNKSPHHKWNVSFRHS